MFPEQYLLTVFYICKGCKFWKKHFGVHIYLWTKKVSSWKTKCFRIFARPAVCCSLLWRFQDLVHTEGCACPNSAPCGQPLTCQWPLAHLQNQTHQILLHITTMADLSESGSSVNCQFQQNIASMPKLSSSLSPEDKISQRIKQIFPPTNFCSPLTGQLQCLLPCSFVLCSFPEFKFTSSSEVRLFFPVQNLQNSGCTASKGGSPVKGRSRTSVNLLGQAKLQQICQAFQLAD